MKQYAAPNMELVSFAVKETVANGYGDIEIPAGDFLSKTIEA